MTWAEFEHDPRDAQYAEMRASDRDRDLIHQMLGDAFADGRLDREEFDERADRVNQSKALGELPPVVADLVPTGPTKEPSKELSVATRSELRQRAERKYAEQRTAAIMSFLFPSLITWGIWLALLISGSGTAFPWPVFVSLGTGMGLLNTVMNKQSHVDRLERSLQRKALKGRKA